MKRDDNYNAHYKRVFGTVPVTTVRHTFSEKSQTASAELGEADLRETHALRTLAGAGPLLTAEEVVHALLALMEIRDPERWLRRHGAPVALCAGHSKRYLAADVLEWAAGKFAPSEQSKQALLNLAASCRESSPDEHRQAEQAVNSQQASTV